MGAKAIVLLSGGLDSTTCLTLAVARHDSDILAVSFNYGQKHSKELEHAAKIVHHFGVDHSVVTLPDIFRGGPSTLMQDGPNNPVGKYSDLPEGPSPTYVPFRNGNLLSTATAIAVQNAAEEVWFGAHSDDAARWAYPDCSPEFIGAMANAIYIGTYQKTRLVTPLEWLTKAQVVAVGLTFNAPYSLSWSCYNGREKACGLCPTCQDRLEAFRLNGVPDPIEYEVVRVG